jgi:protein-L-isoaspartate(D-aspartate) O-methyltransferase
MEAVDFNNMRRAMVDGQLRTSGITCGWVIAAMGELPRENYVPEGLRSTAYMDRSFAGDHALNPPVATALMLQAADVASDDKVLLVGTPGGYMADLLSMRTSDILTIETLADLPDMARFSLVVIDSAITELPDSMLGTAQDGTRIVTGIVERGVTRLASGIVRGGKIALRPFADTEIAVLPAFAAAPEFVF